MAKAQEPRPSSLFTLIQKLPAPLAAILRRIPFIAEYLDREAYLAWLEEQVNQIYQRHKKLEARLMEIEKNHQELTTHFAQLLEFHHHLQKRIQFMHEIFDGIFESRENLEKRMKLIEDLLNEMAQFFRMLERESSTKLNIFELPDLRDLPEGERTVWLILRLKGKPASRGIFSEN
ncbi:MAG: hypothetical protein J7555_11425 [Chloroflexi bacterium]|jgi:DNA repair exonuclease SbcCD ATPase subunit|nr:hypothetical protein [Chloroflexota bacterium]